MDVDGSSPHSKLSPPTIKTFNKFQSSSPLPGGGRHCRTIIERRKMLRHGMRWSDLDSLLVQFRESRSICLRVVCPWTSGGSRARDWAVYLLLEATKREVIAHLWGEPS